MKNPEGMGFPGSRNFSSYPAASNPDLIFPGSGLHWGGVTALVVGMPFLLALLPLSADEVVLMACLG